MNNIYDPWWHWLVLLALVSAVLTIVRIRKGRRNRPARETARTQRQKEAERQHAEDEAAADHDLLELFARADDPADEGYSEAREEIGKVDLDADPVYSDPDDIARRERIERLGLMADCKRIIHEVKLELEVAKWGDKVRPLLTTLATEQAAEVPDLERIAGLEKSVREKLLYLMADTRKQLTQGFEYDFDSAEPRVLALWQQLFDSLTGRFHDGGFHNLAEAKALRARIVGYIDRSHPAKNKEPEWGYPIFEYPPSWDLDVVQNFTAPLLAYFSPIARSLSIEERHTLVDDALIMLETEFGRPEERLTVKLALAYLIADESLFGHFGTEVLQKLLRKANGGYRAFPRRTVAALTAGLPD